MNRYILPTAEIVGFHHQHDELFSFYDDGVKGIVRDNVLLSAGWRLTCDGLIDKIIEDYKNSPHAIVCHYTENTSAELYVEIIATLIETKVRAMMDSIFMTAVYDVSKTEWDWLGNDLVTHIRIYDTGQ